MRKEIEDKTRSFQSQFESLYQTHYKQLVVYATKILGSELYAYDIVSDVFVKYWALQNEKVEIREHKNYLFKMTHNLCMDRLRKRSCEKRLKYHLALNNTSANVTQQMVEYCEYEKLLQDAINRLSPQRKKIFVLMKVEGWSRHEIAEAMGISEATVKETLRLAVQTIRAEISSRAEIKCKKGHSVKLNRTYHIWTDAIEKKVA